jgi:signal transduction histidine kinase/CheY-like chemotaxis protein/class 3 adenylate cyclase
VKKIIERIKHHASATSTMQALPWLLLTAAIFLFMLFIVNLQQQNNVESILQRLKDKKEIIALDEWQALPYHCPHTSQSLEHCELISSTETTVTFPRSDHFFPLLLKEREKSLNKKKLPNAARLKYRFKINELDWLKNPQRTNTLLLSLVIARTSQDLMFVYTEPASATQHGGRLVNVIANFGKEDLLQSAEINIDIIAPSYERQFGPQTLPIALMTPSRTTPYLNLLHQMQSSSLPATLLALMLPVLAAAMAVILDGSKVMFHISGYAFLRGLQALLAQTLNSLDGRGFNVLGLPISWTSLRIVFFINIIFATMWLAYVIAELVVEPKSKLTRQKNKLIFSTLCATTFLIFGLSSVAGKTPIYQMERLSDLVIGAATFFAASHSLFVHFKKRPSQETLGLTFTPDAQQNLFNPVHFFAFRSLLVTSTTLLMAFASIRDLSSGSSGTMVYDPLDWKQIILVPILLLCAVLGVGSVTQKMNEYARIMRRRVEQLMIGSRTLASSKHHIEAVLAALKILGKEITPLAKSKIEIILPAEDSRKMTIYTLDMEDCESPEKLDTPVERDGTHPLPDDYITLISDRILTIQLFQESRWLGTVTLACISPLFLTHEEEHFIKVAQQTLCLTLDNLSAINELRKTDKLKDDFLANTSHELRTPLHGIVGIAETLLSGSEGGISGKIRENMSLIAISGRRLTNLVNDLLDFSQIKKRDLKLRISEVEIRPMVQLVLALSKPLLGGKPVELQNNVEPNVPLVACDEERLQQILQNLIGNAIKFTNSGRVTISAQLEGRFVKISVKDTGIGIHPSKKQRIFNSFEQADGAINRIYGGTGLGLTITKQLVEMHGGNIQVDSQLDAGSEFTFTLPAAQMNDATFRSGSHENSSFQKQNRPALLENQQQWWEVTDQKKSETTSVTDNTLRGSGYRVLIMDDDSINRKVLENQLQNENYQIQLAEDGIIGLQMLKNSKPDIVLLDLMMPRMSGLDVLAEIRKTFKSADLPVIILTAKNQINDLVSCFHAGANDFLMKPFSQSELLARMRNHLQISKVHGAYSRFIPQDFLQLLGRESIVDVRLGDQVLREMAVMFLDIRQFSKLSEGLTPKENFDFLNEYFATVNPIIRNHCGFIDKYIGDAVMALFANRPDDALLAGVDLLKELENYNNRRKSSFRNPLNIGIGVHFGPLMLGTLGNEERMEGTVIAESVNLASRLESITKTFSVGLVTSHDSIIMTQNPKHFDFRSLGRVRPPGLTRALNIVEVFNSDSPHMRELKRKTLERHEKSLQAFQASHWDTAIEGWKKILDDNPADRVAALYLDRAVRNKQTPPSEDWDGVFDLRGR